MRYCYDSYNHDVCVYRYFKYEDGIYAQDATMTENLFNRRLNHAFPSFQVSTTQHRDAPMVTTMNPGGREMMNLVKNMEMEHTNVLVAAPGNMYFQSKIYFLINTIQVQH